MNALIAFHAFLHANENSITAYVSKHTVNSLFQAIGLEKLEKQENGRYSSFRGRFKCLLLGAAGTIYILIGPITAIAIGIFAVCAESRGKGHPWGYAIGTQAPDVLLAIPISVITGVSLVVLGVVGATVDPVIPHTIKDVLFLDRI